MSCMFYQVLISLQPQINHFIEPFDIIFYSFIWLSLYHVDRRLRTKLADWLGFHGIGLDSMELSVDSHEKGEYNK